MAVGSVVGALLAAGREKPRFRFLLTGATIFGIGCAFAALAPNYWVFGAFLVVIGMAAQTFTTSTNAIVQLSTEPLMRGRVLAILLAMLLGGTLIGAPIVGWLVDQFGPRMGLAVGAGAGAATVLVGLCYLARYRHLKLSLDGGRLHVSFDATT
jgi:MFS family permease